MKTKAFLLLWFFIGLTPLSSKESGGKGNFIVYNTYVVTLRPGITMGQYLDFLRTKYIPEYDKNFPGSSLTISSPDFWMVKNQYALFFMFDSEKEYHGYYPKEKEMSSECKAGWEKMKSVEKEAYKYISDKKRVDTEWGTWADEVIVK